MVKIYNINYIFLTYLQRPTTSDTHKYGWKSVQLASPTNGLWIHVYCCSWNRQIAHCPWHRSRNKHYPPDNWRIMAQRDSTRDIQNEWCAWIQVERKSILCWHFIKWCNHFKENGWKCSAQALPWWMEASNVKRPNTDNRSHNMDFQARYHFHLSIFAISHCGSQQLW